MNTVPDLHRLYAQLTGWQLSMSYLREWAWAQFLRRGFTEADLVKVITWLRGEIRKGKRNPGALRFQNLIQDPDHFEEELALASMRDRQFRERSAVPEGKREVLRATGRPEPEEQGRPARPVGELIADLKKAAGMTI